MAKSSVIGAMSLSPSLHVKINRALSLILCIALGGFLTLLDGCASGRKGGHYQPPGSQSPVNLFVTTQVDSLGQVVPEVRASLPYRALVFQREGELYFAAITVTVVAVRGGDRVGGGVGHATARAFDFEQTRATTTLDCNVPVKVRGDGEVQLEVVLQVDDTSRQWKHYLAYNSQDTQALPFYFVDFQWNLASQPLPATLGIDLDSLHVRLKIASHPQVDPWSSGDLELVARLHGGYQGEQNVRQTDLDPAAIGSDGLEYEFGWTARQLPFGEIHAYFALEGRKGEEIGSVALDPPRKFVNLSVPWWDDRGWRRHVAWLEGVIEEDRREWLLKTEQSLRLERWRSLWQAVGAATAVPPFDAERAHMLRIVEADAQFTVFGRGALSDRGRVYIRLGPPDRVETNLADPSREGRWEIWYYNNDQMSYTFYDPHGMGDYHLYSSSTL